MDKYPLQFLVTTMITNEEGRNVRVLATPEESLGYQVTRNTTMRVLLWSGFAAMVLDEAAKRGKMSRDELVAHFTTGFIAPEIAARFAAGYEHYWNGRYDEAVCVVVPRLEAVVREAARAMGISIFNEPTATDPGMYRTLGALLSELRGRIPERTYAYLNAVIVDPLAINLRNRLCHGLLVEGGREEAALALHTAAILAIHGLRTPADADRSDGMPAG